MIFVYSFYLSGGKVFNSTNTMIGFNQPLHTGEIVTVEVDNRSDQESQRIARWFINGTPQPVVVAGVPPLIHFGV